MAQETTKKMSKTKTAKRERFVKVAERRVNMLLKNLDSLGKCSNKGNYEYGEEDVEKIFSSIEEKVKEVKALFQGKTQNREPFKL